ncbi:hypothetical protein IV83_GL000324 [Pediococcus inopinatus]|nr:hypothetical protein IV83_GL000324 [Pediococcus inopinatus]
MESGNAGIYWAAEEMTIKTINKATKKLSLINIYLIIKQSSRLKNIADIWLHEINRFF